MKSHPENICAKTIKNQIDQVLNDYKDDLPSFQLLSVGNEGSILDRKRFPKEAFDYLIGQLKNFPSLEILSLETRPEYITLSIINQIKMETDLPLIDFTIGFETQDDYLREVVLNKTLKKHIVEEKIKLLGECGARLTSYVMLKPGPTMTEHEGIKEAIRTIEYLKEQCEKTNTSLVIYLNPVYVAKGTPLSQQCALYNYTPPRIQSIIEVIAGTRHFNVPIYTGLWSEDNAQEKGDYLCLETNNNAIRKALIEYNKYQNYDDILSFVKN